MGARQAAKSQVMIPPGTITAKLAIEFTMSRGCNAPDRPFLPPLTIPCERTSCDEEHQQQMYLRTTASGIRLQVLGSASRAPPGTRTPNPLIKSAKSTHSGEYYLGFWLALVTSQRHQRHP